MSSVKHHFNQISSSYDLYKQRNNYYYQNLKNLLNKLIPKGSTVIEIGCGTGNILSAVHPRIGLGIDISPKMINIAKRKHGHNRNLKFKTVSIEKLKSRNKWEYVVLVDVIEHLNSIEKTISAIKKHTFSQSKIIVTMANPRWEPLLLIAEKLNLKMPEGPHFRVSYASLSQVFKQNNFKVISHGFELLFPVWIPFFSSAINRILTPLFRRYAFIEYIVAAKEDF